MPSLIRKTVRDNRRALIGWMVGLAAVVSMYLSFYGRYKDLQQAKAATVPEGLRKVIGFDDILTGVGYLQATVYGLLGPLLLIMCAAILGNRGIAGPEEGGVLDLLLANPISRRRFVLGRFLALAGSIVAVAAVPWVLVLVFASALDMQVSAANISAASLGLLLLALCFGMVAFTTGAATGRRGVVLAVTGGLAVGTYVLKGLSAEVTGLGWLRWFSPFHYFSGSNPLRHGFDVPYLLVLAGLSAVLLAVAVVTFDRRDVGV